MKGQWSATGTNRRLAANTTTTPPRCNPSRKSLAKRQSTGALQQGSQHGWKGPRSSPDPCCTKAPKTRPPRPWGPPPAQARPPPHAPEEQVGADEAAQAAQGPLPAERRRDAAAQRQPRLAQQRRPGPARHLGNRHRPRRLPPSLRPLPPAAAVALPARLRLPALLARHG